MLYLFSESELQAMSKAEREGLIRASGALWWEAWQAYQNSYTALDFNMYKEFQALHNQLSNVIYELNQTRVSKPYSYRLHREVIKREAKRNGYTNTLNILESDSVIRLPATTEALAKDNTNMDSPMFSQPENEVVCVFNEYGSLVVRFNVTLDKSQIAQYQYGILNAVKGIVRADHYGMCGDCSEFDIIIRNNQAKRAFDIRRDVQAYTEGFLARLAPAAAQSSLF